MEIKTLTKNKKTLNSILLVSGLLSVFLLGIAAVILGVSDAPSTFTTFFFLMGFIATGIMLIIILLRLFFFDTVYIEKGHHYTLSLNSRYKIEDLKKAKQISHTRNYLTNNTNNTTSELSNKEAFKLFQYTSNKNIDIVINSIETPFLEENPMEWILSIAFSFQQ